MTTSNETSPVSDSIHRRLTELVARRYELIEELTHARNKLVENSLKRELRLVGKEAQRYTSALIGAGYSNESIAQAVSEGTKR